MRKTLEGKGKTLEGEEHLLKEAPLSLQTSLSLRELPPRAPALAERRFDSLCSGRVLLGEVFVGLGGGELLQRAAIALVWWVWRCTAVNK